MTSIIEHPIEAVEAAIQPDLTMRDISSWNGVPDIPSLGANIIAVKATEGTGYISPVFQRDWINVENAKRGRIAYHFFHPSVSPTAQARFFLDTVKNAGLGSGDCLALDHESTDGLTATEVATAAVAFRNAVQDEVKCSLIVYCNLSFANNGNCSGLANQPLWIADPSSPAGKPRIPEPWKSASDLWTFHQYGERGGVDEDICNFKTMDTFYKFAVLPTPPPLTPTQRMVTLTDGTVSTSSLIELANFVSGFKMISGTSVFEVTEG
jgi:lysozyme